MKLLMTPRLLNASILSIAIAAISAAPAVAQEQSVNMQASSGGANNDAGSHVVGNETAGKGDIIVIGTALYSDQINAVKTPTPIIDVPQSLSIINSDQILERGYNSVSQIIDYTPGVSTSQGEGHRDSVVFRGVRSTADFYIDGMRDDVQYYRSLYNLEQVEILRGPNALLFGRGGTGGILNRVTKKGTLGEVFGSGQVAMDTFGAFSIQGDVNIAAGKDTAIRINAMYEHLGNQRDFYNGDRFGFNPTVKFRLGPDTTLDLSYEYANNERFVDRGIPTGSDGLPVEAFDEITFGDPVLNTTELEAHLLRATLQHNFTEHLKGNFSAFYGDYNKFYQNFYVSSYDQANMPGIVTLDAYADLTSRANLILASNFVADFDTGSINHTLLAGGEFIQTSSSQNRYNSFWSETQDDNEIFAISRPLDLRRGIGINAAGNVTSNDFTADLNDDTRVNIDVFSLFIQDEIKLTDWLNVVLGGRYDSFDIQVRNVPATDTRSRKDIAFSPRAGVIFKPQANISIYGSYSKSFLPRSGEQFANINGNNDALDPNEYTNLEAGIKWDFNRGLSLTAAIFEIEENSPQIADNDPSTLDVIKARIQGFEIQLQGRVTDFWNIYAGYSYLDGEQVANTGQGTGLRPRELPKNMFSIWNALSLGKFGLGLGLTYQDDSFVNNSNSARLPSYMRMDAAAHYDVSERVRIQVNVENLLDTDYYPNSHSTHQVTVGAPVNARIAVTGKF